MTSPTAEGPATLTLADPRLGATALLQDGRVVHLFACAGPRAGSDT